MVVWVNSTKVPHVLNYVDSVDVQDAADAQRMFNGR